MPNMKPITSHMTIQLDRLSAAVCQYFMLMMIEQMEIILSTTILLKHCAQSLEHVGDMAGCFNQPGKKPNH